MITPKPGYIVDPANPNAVIRDPGVPTGPGATPVVTPPANPSNIQGTLTTPPTVTPSPVPPGGTPAQPTSEPTVTPSTTPGAGMDATSFMNVLGGIKKNYAADNELIKQKNLLVKGLFTSPLTPEQVAQLPEDMQRVWNSGNKDAIQLQIQALNERIQGGTSNFANSVNYLVNGYKTAVDDAQKKRSEAIDIVKSFVSTYKDKAGPALKALYGPGYVDTLKEMGIDVDEFSKLSGGGSPTSYVPGVDPTTDAYVAAVRNNTIKLENVPEDRRGLVVQGVTQASAGGSDPKKDYVRSQAETALTSIDSALGILSGEKSGLVNTAGGPIRRALTGWIPGSDTKNLNEALTTVKALIGFDTLAKMRESSPTGGALGAISERELAYLQSVQGSLDTSQSNENLKKTIERIRQSFATLQMVNSKDGTKFELDGKSYYKKGNEMIPEEEYIKQEQEKQASNRSQRNNNPLNIKVSASTAQYPGVTGVDPNAASDGGHFITFATPEDGFNAAKRLIQTNNYKDLTVDAALKRWSNNGYGGEITPDLKGKTINSLSDAELDELIKAMAKHEGYYA